VTSTNSRVGAAARYAITVGVDSATPAPLTLTARQESDTCVQSTEPRLLGLADRNVAMTGTLGAIASRLPAVNLLASPVGVCNAADARLPATAFAVIANGVCSAPAILVAVTGCIRTCVCVKSAARIRVGVTDRNSRVAASATDTAANILVAACACTLTLVADNKELCARVAVADHTANPATVCTLAALRAVVCDVVARLICVPAAATVRVVVGARICMLAGTARAPVIRVKPANLATAPTTACGAVKNRVVV
jgi:hypothetical protein